MYSIGIESIIPIVFLIIIGVMFCFIYTWYTNGVILDIKSGKLDIQLIDEAIYENLSSVKKRKKISKTINSIVFYGLLICIAPFFIFAIINKTEGNITNFGDKGILVVASGSMSYKNSVNEYLFENDLNNQFSTFDIIIVEKVDSDDDLKLYDVVTFVDSSGKNIIHRIIEIDDSDPNNIIYKTRGDAAKVTDPVSTIANIKGKYTNIRIRYIGAVVLFFQSTLGIGTLVILGLCLIFNDKQTEKINKVKNERLDKFQMIDYKGSISSDAYHEEIYYNSFVYYFNDKGFVEKKENTNDDIVLEENQLIKIYKEKNMETQITKFYIEREM